MVSLHNSICSTNKTAKTSTFWSRERPSNPANSGYLGLPGPLPRALASKLTGFIAALGSTLISLLESAVCHQLPPALWLFYSPGAEWPATAARPQLTPILICSSAAQQLAQPYFDLPIGCSVCADSPHS